MQIVTWTGQGEGTLVSPFILNVEAGFDPSLSFNIKITGNYIESQNEINYFKFSNSLTIYTLGYYVTNRDSLIYIRTSHAIKVSLFLTDKNNVEEGPYVVHVHDGQQYLIKQQMFDAIDGNKIGNFLGDWEAGRLYGVDNVVLYNNDLYSCLTENHDSTYDAAKWRRITTLNTVEFSRAPLSTDNTFNIGTVWIDSTNDKVYFLSSITDSVSVWIDFHTLIDDTNVRIDELLEGNTAVKYIKLEDPDNPGNFATIKYTHTNGNHFQVVDIIYPDGRSMQIGEQFDHPFRSIVDAELNSGAVLMSAGVTQGNQAIDGELFDENSMAAYNIVGVLTIDGVNRYDKSHATNLGFVHGINTFYDSGLGYVEGQQLWAREGLLSNVPPPKPALQVRMGALINTSGSNDALICPLIFQKFESLSDVQITNPQDDDIYTRIDGLIKNIQKSVFLSDTAKLSVANTFAAAQIFNEVITFIKEISLSDQKLKDVAEGVVDTDGANIKNVNDKIGAHNTSTVSHNYILGLIEALEREVLRLNDRGKGFGEIDYTTAVFEAMDQATLAETIKDDIEAEEWFTGTYVPAIGDRIYDTGIGNGVEYHEWEYNGIAWVDNGPEIAGKANNDLFGIVKGNEYVSIVAGIMQVVLADTATKIKDAGSELGFTYSELVAEFNKKFDKTGGTISGDTEIRNSLTTSVALIVNALESTTAGLQSWKLNGIQKVLLDPQGRFYTDEGVSNLSTPLGSSVNTKETGTEITRNIADSNAALIVDLVHAASTGNIQEWKHAGVIKAKIDRYGAYYGNAFYDIADISYYMKLALDSISINARGAIHTEKELVAGTSVKAPIHKFTDTTYITYDEEEKAIRYIIGD